MRYKHSLKVKLTAFRYVLGVAALISGCVFSPPAFALGNVLTALPDEGSLVEADDIISYHITIETGAEIAKKTFLRIELGEGLQLLEESIQINDMDNAPQATPSFAGEEETSPEDAQALPPQYTFVPGNNGFVLICPDLYIGDSFTFDAKVGENANPSITLAGEALHATLTHTYHSQSAQVAAPLTQDDLTPQEIDQSSDAPPVTWLWALAGIPPAAAAIFLIYRKRHMKKSKGPVS